MKYNGVVILNEHKEEREVPGNGIIGAILSFSPQEETELRLRSNAPSGGSVWLSGTRGNREGEVTGCSDSSLGQVVSIPMALWTALRGRPRGRRRLLPNIQSVGNLK